jgi:hypothetical protein
MERIINQIRRTLFGSGTASEPIASRRVARGPLFVAIVLLAAGWARAEHFDIDLTVLGTKDPATAHADTDPPPQGFNPRPVCHAKKGEELTLQFFVNSNFPHGTIKGVGVHYFIAPEKEAGKKSPPDPSQPAVLDGSFVMDFKPDTGRVGLRQRLHIDKPGAYVVRVESQNSASDHEHFAALDLVIE